MAVRSRESGEAERRWETDFGDEEEDAGGEDVG